MPYPQTPQSKKKKSGSGTALQHNYLTVQKQILHHYLQQFVILKIFSYTWNFILKSATFHPNSESESFLTITLASAQKGAMKKDSTVFTDLLVPCSHCKENSVVKLSSLTLERWGWWHNHLNIATAILIRKMHHKSAEIEFPCSLVLMAYHFDIFILKLKVH